MQKITKQEMDYLISSGIIRLNKVGNYGDQLVVTGSRHHKRNQHNSQHKARQKQRYTIDYTYNKLLEAQEKDYEKLLLDLDNIKDNQKYLFSDT